MLPQSLDHPLHVFVNDPSCMHAMAVQTVTNVKNDCAEQVEANQDGLIDVCGSRDAVVEHVKDKGDSLTPSHVEAVASCASLDDESGDEVASMLFNKNGCFFV